VGIDPTTNPKVSATMVKAMDSSATGWDVVTGVGPGVKSRRGITVRSHSSTHCWTCF